MRERERSMVVKVDDGDLAKAHALAEPGDEPISFMVRRWIEERYSARFGDAVPGDAGRKLTLSAARKLTHPAV
jgi:hypothetical protein